MNERKAEELFDRIIAQKDELAAMRRDLEKSDLRINWAAVALALLLGMMIRAAGMYLYGPQIEVAETCRMTGTRA